MKMQLRLLLLLGGLSLATIPAMGCGGTECGQGTTEKNGKCVPTGTQDEDPDAGEPDVSEPDVIEPDGSVSCGPGTKLEGDQCVPTGTTPEPGECPEGSEFDEEKDRCVLTEDACGPMTTLNEDGRCVISPDICDEGQALDPNSGTCVDGTECGEGTALDTESGNCVPTDQVCHEGTEFDEETGLCLPDSSCRAGDVVLDGICVSPAEDLAARADVTESENNDPDMGGEPDELVVKGAGGATIFTGVIGEPTDLDGDGEVDQDVDVFSFEAEEGGWYELSVQSLGLPSPLFIIDGPNNYSRISSLASAQDPARQFVAPTDGTYTITVLPTAAVAFGNGGPFGGDDWEYVGVLKQLDAPTPSAVDMSEDPISGSYGLLTDSFYQVDGFDAGDLITLTLSESGRSADAVMQLWSGTEGYLSEMEVEKGDTFTMIVPADNELQLVMDWELIAGPGTAYELEANLTENVEALGTLDDGETVTDPVDIDNGESQLYTFNIDAGKILELSFDHSATASGQLTLRNAAGNLVQRFSSVSAGSVYNYWYSGEGGTFVLEVEASSYSTADLSDVVTTFNIFAPHDLGSPSIGDSISENISDPLDSPRSYFHILDLNEPLLVSGDFTSEDDKDIDVYFMDESMERFKTFVTTGSETITPTIVPAGVTLIQVRAYADTASYEVNLDFSKPPQVEVEPNDTKDEATPVDISELIQSVSSGTSDVDYYSFELDDDMAPGEVLLVELSIESTTSMDEFICTLLDSNEEPVGSNNPEGITRGCISMVSDLVGSETYYLKIEREYGSAATTYFVESRIEQGLVEAEANDTLAEANAFEFDDLAQGSALYGHLEDQDTVDYFSFELTDDMDEEAYLIFDLERIGSNPQAAGIWSLLDEAGEEIASASVNSSMEVASLSAGTYYLELTRSTSTYWYSLAYKITMRQLVMECGNGVVEADEECDGEYYCSDTCEIMPPSVSVTNDDSQDFDNTTTPLMLQVNAGQCDSIRYVSVDVDFSSTWRDEVFIDLTSPDGTNVRLHDADEGPTSQSFTGNYPEDFTVHGPGSLDDFVGEDGSGDWTFTIDYRYGFGTPSFNSFTLNLYCD